MRRGHHRHRRPSAEQEGSDGRARQGAPGGREGPAWRHVAEVLLVIDATTGQNGMQQARVFSEAVNITGIVLTKLDGTAKGGIVVNVQRELGVPVKMVGLGEGMDDLTPFDPYGFVERSWRGRARPLVEPSRVLPITIRGRARSSGCDRGPRRPRRSSSEQLSLASIDRDGGSRNDHGDLSALGAHRSGSPHDESATHRAARSRQLRRSRAGPTPVRRCHGALHPRHRSDRLDSRQRRTLVLLMTPGLSLFYGGMVRARTVLNMMLMSFGAHGGGRDRLDRSSGYSIAFGDRRSAGVAREPVWSTSAWLAPTSSRSLAGQRRALPGRRRIPDDFRDHLHRPDLRRDRRPGQARHLDGRSPRSGCSSSTPRSRTWSGAADCSAPTALFAAIAEPVDFAGGTVVHINAGVAGLVLALVVGSAEGLRHGADEAAQPAAGHARCRAAVVRLVRVQCRSRRYGATPPRGSPG